MANLTIGVVILRGHVPEPHDGHRALFQYVQSKSDRFVALIGVSPVDGRAAGYELFFPQRAAIIGKAVPGAIVFALADKPTNEEWSRQIDGMLKMAFPGDSITLYGGRKSFIESYTGKFPVEHVTEIPTIDISGTEIRAALKQTNIEDFYRGQIYAIQQQYPHAYATADMALLRTRMDGADFLENPKADPSKMKSVHDVFLIQRVDTGDWVLPGGFVDPEQDESARAAAKRELREETGLYVESALEWVWEGKVNDWRYRATKDKIFTTLFAGYHAFGQPVLNPKEAADYQWAPVDKAITIVAVQHTPLLVELAAWLQRKYDAKVAHELDKIEAARP
jgi:bifunctional NMN adenylyltransferase/nudix hydrolase